MDSTAYRSCLSTATNMNTTQATIERTLDPNKEDGNSLASGLETTVDEKVICCSVCNHNSSSTIAG